MNRARFHPKSAMTRVNRMRFENRRLAEIAYQAETLFVALDAAGRVTAIHPRLAARQGSGVDDLLGQPFTGVFPHYKGTAVEAALHRVAGRLSADRLSAERQSAEQDETLEWREPPHAGRAGQWFSIRVAPLSDGLVVYFRDITLEKETRLALEEQEHFSQSMNQVVPAIVYLYDFRLKSVTFFNAEVLKQFGYTPEEFQEIYNGAPERILHPEDLPRFKEHLNRIKTRNEETQFDLEVRMLAGDGSYHWFLNHYIVYRRDPSGQVLQMLGSALDITEVKQAIQALAENEELYRLAAHDTIWDWDLDSNHIRWTDAIAEHYGYPEALAGTDISWWAAHVHPEEREEAIQNVWARINSGEANGVIEYRFRCADGAYAHVLDRFYILREPGGSQRPLRLVGSMQDISLRKRREANDLFLLALGDDLANVASEEEAIHLTVNRVGEYFHASRCLLVEFDTHTARSHIFPDYHPDRKSVAGIYGPDMIPTVFRMEFSTPGEQFAIDDTQVNPLCAPDYATFYCPLGLQAYVQTPTVTENGWRGSMLVASGRPRRWPADDLRLMSSVAYLFWLALDKVRLLEYLRQSEAAERDSAHRFQVVLERAGMGIFEQDRQLRYTYIHNPIPEYARLNPIGKTDAEILGTEASSQITALKQRVLETGEPVHKEIEVRFEARTYSLDMYLEALRDEQGRATGILGSVLDITERHNAEEAAREYARRLESSNRDLQDFAFIASHDLQEPLRKVRNFGDRLKLKYKDALNEEGQDYLDRMVSAAERMRKMIDDLLDYSRVTTKTQEFRRVDLNQVAQDVLGVLEVRLEATGGQVKVGPLPVIDGDPTQMHQLFQNLIGNALKFTRPGVPPLVQVQARPVEPGVVELTFQDNGIGFETQYLDRIFQPFQRLHGRSEFEGSGIGLAICRRIVEHHHGSITARSIVGQGSVFLVHLPLKERSPIIDPSAFMREGL